MDIHEIVNKIEETRYYNPKDVSLIIDVAEFNRHEWNTIIPSADKQNELWHLIVQTAFIFKRLAVPEGLKCWEILIANLRVTLEKTIEDRNRDINKFERIIEKTKGKIAKTYGDKYVIDYKSIDTSEIIKNSYAVQDCVQANRGSIADFNEAIDLLSKIIPCVEQIINALIAFEKRSEINLLLITMSNTFSNLLKAH